MPNGDDHRQTTFEEKKAWTLHKESYGYWRGILDPQARDWIKSNLPNPVEKNVDGIFVSSAPITVPLNGGTLELRVVRGMWSARIEVPEINTSWSLKLLGD